MHFYIFSSGARTCRLKLSRVTAIDGIEVTITYKIQGIQQVNKFFVFSRMHNVIYVIYVTLEQLMQPDALLVLQSKKGDSLIKQNASLKARLCLHTIHKYLLIKRPTKIRELLHLRPPKIFLLFFRFFVIFQQLQHALRHLNAHQQESA